MHVLHIFNEINFSGAEIMYADAAPLFQANGIRMTAVNTGKKKGAYIPEFEKAQITTIHRPLPQGIKSPGFLMRYFRDVYRYIKKENIDVVHVHRSDVFWLYALVAAAAGRKTIMTPHNVFTNRKITWIKAYLERLSARKLLRTTFQTIGDSVYYNELHYYKNPSVKINNWYNARRFFPPAAGEKSSMRKKLGLQEDDFVIVSTGSCSTIKNHTAIIQALAMVMAAIPSCTYLHLGCGPLEEEEKKTAAALQVHDRVQFLGNKVNVRDYLVASDIFVMTSALEGLSIASLEAMACQLPCILYDSPGLRDVMDNNNNGFLVNCNAAAVAEKIIHFRNNPGEAAEKGCNAYRFASGNFNMEKGVRSIIELYNNHMS